MTQDKCCDQVSIESLRQLAHDAFTKHMNATASSLAEEVVRLVGSTFEDELFYASCLFYGQEYRRCLALLEHKNMLSAEILYLIGDLLLRGAVNNDGYLIIPASTSVSSSAILSKSSAAAAAVDTTINIPSSSSSISINSSLSAVLLAAQCLLSLEQYADCLLLLETLITTNEGILMTAAVNSSRNLKLLMIAGSEVSASALSTALINPMAGIYNAAGRCYDQQDNLECARKCYTTAVSIDPVCVEAVDTLVSRSHLSPQQRSQLFTSIDFTTRPWVRPYYHSLLLSELELDSIPPFSQLQEPVAQKSSSSSTTEAANYETKNSNNNNNNNNPNAVDNNSTQSTQQQQQQQVYGTPLIGLTTHPHSNALSVSTASLVRASEHLLDHSQQTNEAYRLARAAYVQDPFNRRGVMAYIACLVELNLTAELFYLGHELTQLHPKQALGWYAVGCYYYCCRKFEAAQKHFHKCTKIDKRFVAGYVMAGRALGQQEEREHAVSAYRTACRLLPGDHRPVVLMAKELMKTNCISLALHLLSAALESAPYCPVTLNELGVAYLRLDREEDALEALARSVHCLHHRHSGRDSVNEERRTAGAEIYCNYGTALRRMGRWERALQWYALSLAEDPHDHDTHAAIGYTYHLLRRFDAAITSYHRALALHPASAFCAEMLSRALADTCLYMDVDDVVEAQQEEEEEEEEENPNNSYDMIDKQSNSAVHLSFSDQ